MRLLDLRAGLYRDSVRLMQISAALSGLPGVQQALVAMATRLNLDLLPRMGFAPPTDAGPDDLMVALVATDDVAMSAVLDRLEVELADRGLDGADGAGPPSRSRTTGTAVAALGRQPASGPAIALVSTPGRYAFVEAMDALDAGASVMIFSDNVPVEQEVVLKRRALERGLLVMGPDCGTAVIGGVGLGFANVVRPGPVGLVAASGTGAQQVMSLLSWAGVGVSHCLGVGGRDLSEAVGGLSTHAALGLLDADPTTELIVLVAKPPAPGVAAAVREHATGLATPVVMAPLGAGEADLTAVTETVLSRLGVEVPPWPHWPAAAAPPPGAGGASLPSADGASLPSAGGASLPSAGGALRGLFAGGTLCVEAMAIAADSLGTVRSNVPLRPEWSMQPGWTGHALLDLGADEFTSGRPHPMIDPGPRLDRFAAEAADPSCVVLLLDVVLGHAADPDPAAGLGPAVRAARQARGDLSVVVSLIGTADDPQGLTGQAEALSSAGACVHGSNAQAARHAVALAQGRPQ